MGDLRACFDTAAYQRALADVEAIGFDMSGETTKLNGQYYCDDSNDNKFLIDLSERVTGYVKGQSIWVDRSGRMFKVIEANDLPRGVLSVAWIHEWDWPTDDLMYESLYDFYQCETKGNKKCVEEVKESVVAERVRIEAKEKAEAEAKRQREVALAEAKRRAEEAKRQQELETMQVKTLEYISENVKMRERISKAEGVFYSRFSEAYDAGLACMPKPKTIEDIYCVEKNKYDMGEGLVTRADIEGDCKGHLEQATECDGDYHWHKCWKTTVCKGGHYSYSAEKLIKYAKSYCSTSCQD